MEPIVIAATITGTAAMAAAGIQAMGNISAAKHKAAEAPAQKEVAQAQVTDRPAKRDWAFWGILVFMTFWWIQAIVTVDLSGSRYMLACIILSPSVVLFMVVIKVVIRLLRL